MPSIAARLRKLLRPIARYIPPMWRVRLRRALGQSVAPSVAPSNPDYDRRASEELTRFAAEENVNDLPAIFHYWSNTYLRKRLEAFGFSYPEDFFAVEIARQRERVGRPIEVVSIGAGNCDSEVRVAKLLRERGVTGVAFECVDLNGVMLERGRSLAQAEGFAESFRFVEADFNRWRPTRTYDVVLANQSLHHVVELEHLFDAIAEAIGTHGIFVTSDMIGRNGHQRWPEALEILQEYWNELPDSYRWNVQLRRQEHQFMNWDCSVEGFEGIRAEDILPLLVRKFGFRFFFGYGNLIDPFTDRSFGPHFDADADRDRNLIDRVHARDEAEMIAGRIKPTHMLAVLTNDRDTTPVIWENLSPQHCVRHV